MIQLAFFYLPGFFPIKAVKLPVSALFWAFFEYAFK